MHTFKCEADCQRERTIEAVDEETAAEIYASDCYYDGDKFDSLHVKVTDDAGDESVIEVLAEPSIEFYANV